MNSPLMKCGHAANARDMATGKPICVICFGIVPGADEVDDNPPDLTGRVARCSCGKEAPSSPKLAFFDYGVLPDGSNKYTHGKDSFYCGCRGWD